MKSFLPELLLAAFVAYAVFAHYLIYFNAKRLIYADFEKARGRDGSGAYTIRKVDVDSIRYAGKYAKIYYRLTATYTNGSVKDAAGHQYEAGPTHLEMEHGFMGWKTE